MARMRPVGTLPIRLSDGEYCDPAKVAVRQCLQCGRSFNSAGPHNRRCGQCKQGERQLSRLAGQRMAGRGKGNSGTKGAD